MKTPFSFSHLIGFGGTKPKTATTPAAEEPVDDETDDETDDDETTDETEEEDGDQEPKPEATAPKKPKSAKSPKPKKKAEEQLTAAAAAARAEGASEERTRCGAIFASEHAAGREALAAHFAFNSDLSAEAAIQALAASPKGGKSGRNALASAMSHIEEPNLGPTGGNGGDKKPGTSLIENAKARAAAQSQKK